MQRTGVEGRTAPPTRPETEPADIGSSQTARAEAREKGRRLAAELVGAMEGLLESLEENDLERDVSEAASEARKITTETVGELRRQGRTPEGRAIRQDLRRGGQTMSDEAESLLEDTREQAANAWHATQETAEEAVDAVERGWEQVKETSQDVAERVEHAGHAVVDETKARSQNLARAARRSKRAPGAIYRDINQSVKARATGMAVGLGLYVLAGAVALSAFIVFTVALVAGLTQWAGSPEGGFLVAAIYALGAAGIVYGAMAARRKKQDEAHEHMVDAKREVRNVTRPLRRVFARYRITPPRETIEPRGSNPPAAYEYDAPRESLPDRNEWSRR